MTFHVRDATDNPISFSVLTARDPITCPSMKKAIDVDPWITVQHFATAGGFVTQANEITICHCLFFPFSLAEAKLFPSVNCPSIPKSFEQRNTEQPSSSATPHGSLDKGQKILSALHAVTHQKHAGTLGRIDNLIAIAETTAHQRKMAIVFPRGRDDVRLTAIGIHNEIALLRCAYLLTVTRFEFHRRCRVLNHAAIPSLAAYGSHSVNSDRGMSFSVGLIFINSRQDLFVETG
jgi:hypothetical protein